MVLENENIKTSSDPKHLFIYDAAGNCLESLEAIFNKYIKEAEHKDGSIKSNLPEWSSSEKLPNALPLLAMRCSALVTIPDRENTTLQAFQVF